MADYAGAVAAIVARFRAQFVACPVQFQNEDPPAQPWPPQPAAPFAYVEVMQVETDTRGVGLPGSKTWLTRGLVVVNVFAPKGFGMAAHLSIAEAAGEVFRAATFYAADPGAKLQELFFNG